MVSERLSRFRPVAASLLGGALIILGLVLLKDAAAPLAEQPWFRELLEGTGDSLALAFLVAALLTFVVQSSSAVTVFGISLAAVGVLSVDQAIMVMYGSLIGSGAILYLLSAGLRGRSRQVAMYLVGYNVLICAVLVPLLYVENHFGVPLVKASALALGLELDQQLAAVYVFVCVFLLPVMLAGLGWSASVLERLWPSSPADTLAHPQFIHDHASVDVETSVVLVDLEQRRAIRDLSGYFDAVRRGERSRRSSRRHAKAPLRHHRVPGRPACASSHARCRRPELASQPPEAPCLARRCAGGALCETLADLDDRSALAELRTTICESVDGVLLSLVEAMECDDRMTWELTRNLTGDRSEMMRNIRAHYLEWEPPLKRLEFINVLLITNAAAEAFFLFSKMEKEFNPAPGIQDYVPRP